jgi:hypothetical protein
MIIVAGPIKGEIPTGFETLRDRNLAAQITMGMGMIISYRSQISG